MYTGLPYSAWVELEFEWDIEKEEKNFLKHRISFADAAQIFNDIDRVAIDSYKNDEKRIKVVGKIGKIICVVVYTYRNNNIRLISARRASKNEREKRENKKS